MITVTRAGAIHANEMANLLNEVIAQGGTTALTEAVTGQDITTWMTRVSSGNAWHVAEDANGHVVGFQWIEPKAYLPPEAADIATFAHVGKTGLGIGSKLFEATKAAAKSMGYTWINASIRADNESGLTYYQSRGFEVYGRQPNVKLPSGLIVDKTLKRYDL